MRSTKGPVRAMAKRGRSDVRARVVLGAATVSVGVVAGTFFAFAVSVMPSLSTVDDKEFVELMNKLNSSIQTNRPFLLSFSGAFLLTGAAAFVHYRLGLRAAARWVLAALVLYLVSFAITIGVNMPLNVALANAVRCRQSPRGLRGVVERRQQCPHGRGDARARVPDRGRVRTARREVHCG